MVFFKYMVLGPLKKKSQVPVPVIFVSFVVEENRLTVLSRHIRPLVILYV